MPELPTCDCISGFPPYDRLTFIYQAAAELSGDTTLPSADCVAGVPPFDRFAYIYAAFRVLAEDDSLPSQECIEGESYQDQVTRIYQAARIYAADDALPAVECVRGLPIWQQWDNIYAALYSAAGEPEELTAPECLNATLDTLSAVYCALVASEAPCVIPTLLSATIGTTGETITLVFDEEVTSTGAGWLVNMDSASSTLTYLSGTGTDTLMFTMDTPALAGESAFIEYDATVGDAASGDCLLVTFGSFPVTNNTGLEFTYLRPGGVDMYFRPDGVSLYIRP
jgi:hypothetical protein